MAYNQLGPTTTSSTFLAGFIATVGSAPVTIWVTTLQVFSVNLTIPSTVELRFIEGGMLKPNNGITLTCNGLINAGNYQIIDLSANGTVTFAANFAQYDYLFNWWGPSTGSSDIGPLLNTITTTTPNYSCLTWYGNPGSGGLTFNIQTTWQPKNCTSRIWQVKGRQTEETNTIVLNYTGTGGAVAVIDLECCGHCTVSGFGINTGAAYYGILIDGQNGVSGGTRISTADTLQYNLINNSSNLTNFVGIAIALTSPANNEFMVLLQNQVKGNGTATAGIGIGIFTGGSSNAHGHLLEHNTCTGCLYGVTATWTGYRMIRGNFTANQTDIKVTHLSYPTEIIFADSENSGTFLRAGIDDTGGESSLLVQNSRIASGGTGGVPVFYLGGAIGHITIANNSFDVFITSSHLYSINSIGQGYNSVRLRENNYINWSIAGTVQLASIFTFPAVNTFGAAPTIINVDGDGLSYQLHEYLQINETPLAPDVNGLITVTQDFHKITGGGNALKTITKSFGAAYGSTNFTQKIVILAVTGVLTITANAVVGGMARSGTLAVGKVANLWYDATDNLWYGTY